MPNYKDPWADTANQAVGALYKHYLSKPSQADMQRGQMENKLLDLKIRGQESGNAKSQFDLDQARQSSEFADKFADSFSAIPQVGGAVPMDGSMGPAMPTTETDRNSQIANLFEQFAPRLDKDTVAASRDAMGTASALRFENPIDRQLALDKKASSYGAYSEGAEQLMEQEFQNSLKEPYTLSPGSVRFGSDNDRVASAPFKTGGGSYIEQPDGTIISIDGGSPPLRPNVQGDLQDSQIATEKLRSLMDYTRGVANKNPLNFGFPGFVKGGVQDVSTLLSGVTTALGYEAPQQAMDEARREIMQSGVDPMLFDGLFDPDLPALQTANDLLIYQAAAALAGQSGRDLSDKDVQNIKKIIGSSTDWFTSQDKFLSKLDTVEHILNMNSEVTDRTLGGNVTDGPIDPMMASQQAIQNRQGEIGSNEYQSEFKAPTGNQPDIVTIQGDEDYDNLPSGTQFIAPDGTTRTKP